MRLFFSTSYFLWPLECTGAAAAAGQLARSDSVANGDVALSVGAPKATKLLQVGAL